MQLPSPPADNKRFRILLVEDDESVAHLVLLHLQKTGFDARHAPDGNSGWHAFKQTDPHMVITDVTMPGLNGWELAAKIREVSGIPILFLTASDSDEDQVHGFKAGADDYVPKPFHPPVLLARVVAHLRRVYRYDHYDPAPDAAAPPPNPLSVPEGWTQCEACGYLGPQFKFEALDPQKGRVFICPNCKNRKLAFSLG